VDSSGRSLPYQHDQPWQHLHPTRKGRTDRPSRQGIPTHDRPLPHRARRHPRRGGNRWRAAHGRERTTHAPANHGIRPLSTGYRGDSDTRIELGSESLRRRVGGPRHRHWRGGGRVRCLRPRCLHHAATPASAKYRGLKPRRTTTRCRARCWIEAIPRRSRLTLATARTGSTPRRVDRCGARSFGWHSGGYRCGHSQPF